MSNSYLTDLQTELSRLGINTEPTEDEIKAQKTIDWQEEKKIEEDRQVVRCVLENVGINPDGDINEQIHNY